MIPEEAYEFVIQSKWQAAASIGGWRMMMEVNIATPCSLRTITSWNLGGNAAHKTTAYNVRQDCGAIGFLIQTKKKEKSDLAGIGESQIFR